jgi:hypothetical protein
MNEIWRPAIQVRWLLIPRALNLQIMLTINNAPPLPFAIDSVSWRFYGWVRAGSVNPGRD